jgi:hypothetical protein
MISKYQDIVFAIDFSFRLCYNMRIDEMKGGDIMNKRQTSKPVASKAAKVLRDPKASKDAKSAAGSALSQTKTGKKK